MSFPKFRTNVTLHNSRAVTWQLRCNIIDMKYNRILRPVPTWYHILKQFKTAVTNHKSWMTMDYGTISVFIFLSCMSKSKNVMAKWETWLFRCRMKEYEFRFFSSQIYTRTKKKRRVHICNIHFIALPRIMKTGQMGVLFVVTRTKKKKKRWVIYKDSFVWYNVILHFISCFPVGYREIAVKIVFDLTLVPPVKMPIFMFLLPRLIARA